MTKKQSWILIFAIFLVALVVRFAFFNEMILFKADQARDAYLIKDAFVEGVEKLTLLGPKGGMVYLEGDYGDRGGTFHLGPLFYYIQYFFALIFNSVEPWVLVLPSIISFIASIPLFYFLADMILSRKYAIGSTAIYAFSFVSFQYSVFAWNPNQMFFWSVLLGLSLLKTIFCEDKTKRSFWFIGVVVSWLVLSQLHFLAFFGIPFLIAIFYFFFRIKKIEKRSVLIAIFLIIFLYLPVGVSESKNDFENSRRILATIVSDDGAISEEDSSVSFFKEIEKTLEREGEFMSIYFFFLNEKEVEWVELAGGILFVFMVLFGLIFLFRRVKFFNFDLYKKGIKPDKFIASIILVLFWQLIFLFFFFLIIEDLDDLRYFLIIIPAITLFPFIVLDKLEELSSEKIKRLIQFVGVFFVFFSVVMNWYGLFHFKKSINEGYHIEAPFKDPRSGPYQDLITIDQQKEVSAFMYENSKENKHYICYKNYNYQYDLPYKYLGEINYSDAYFLRANENTLYQGCSYFFIARSRKKEDDIPKHFMEKFDIINQKSFKATTVFKLLPKEDLFDKKNIVNVKDAWLDSQKKDLNEMEKNINRKIIYWNQL